MKRKILILSIIFFVVDQLTKIILDKILILGKSYAVFEKFLYITKAYNDGVSFSMLEGHRFLVITISIVIMLFLYFYMHKFVMNKRNILAFSLAFGGLFGNLIDRLVHGYVIDFIDFYVLNYNYPIFNFADSFICIGILMLLYAIFMGEDNETSR